MRSAKRFGALSAGVISAALLVAVVGSRAQEFGIYGALHVKSGGPIYECLPGQAVYWEQVPENVREREKCGKASSASNTTVKVDGQLAIDLDAPDPTGLSSPSAPHIVIKFARASKDGSKWSFAPNADAVMERGAVGSSSTQFAFGTTGKGTPLEPKCRFCLRLRGKGRLMKDDKQVGPDLMFSFVVGSRTRDPETGKYLEGYEKIHDEGFEAKLVVDENQSVADAGIGRQLKGLTFVFTRVQVTE